MTQGMFQLARIVLWTVAAVVALVYGYTGTLTYHFDEQNLCIQSDGWLGRSVSRQVIPVASISSVELDMRAGRHAKHSVKIVGKDGGILRRDFLGLQDSNNLAEGLRCALRNHPVGTYEFSCGHTKYKGWFFAFGFIFLAFCEGYDRCQERKLRRAFGKS